MSESEQRLIALREEIAQIRGKICDLRNAESINILREVARRSPSYAPLRVRLQPRRALLGHAGKVHALHWSTDSHHLVSVAQCGKLIVWNAFGATKQLVVPLRSTWVATCAFAPSGRVVASGGMGSVCSIFRVGTTAPNEAVSESRVLIRDLHAPSSASTLLSDTQSASFSSANSSPNSRDAVNVNISSSPFANCCRFIDDRQLVVAYADRSTAVHDVETGAHVRVIAPEASFSSNGVGSLSVAASLVGLGGGSSAVGMDGSFHGALGGALTHDQSGGSIFNNAGTIGQSAGAAESHTLAIVEAASPGAGSSPLPSVIATAGSDGVVRVWDIRTDASKAMRTFTGHESDINALCFLPDGLALASASDDASCRLWDLRSSRQLNHFALGADNHRTSTSISSSNNQLAPSSVFGETTPAAPAAVSTSTLPTSSPMFGGGSGSSGVRTTRAARAAAATSIGCSASGRLLFVGYDDFVMRAWDTIDATCMQALCGHDARISTLGVAPNGRAICTGAWDSVLRVWA